MIRNHIFTSFRGDAKRRTRNDGSQPHLPAGQVLHDLLAAAADRVDLDLAVDALDLDAAHIAGAAEDLHRLGGAERRGRAATPAFQATPARPPPAAPYRPACAESPGAAPKVSQTCAAVWHSRS